MRKIEFIFKGVLFIGLISSLPIVIDSLLPKKTIRAKVIDVFRGVEEGYNSTAPVGFQFGESLTHFRVKLSGNKKYFLVGRSFYDKVHVGDSVVISESTIFEKYSFLENTYTEIGTRPVIGVFSNFYFVIIIQFIGCIIGLFVFKKQDSIVFFGVLMFVLIPINLYQFVL